MSSLHDILIIEKNQDILEAMQRILQHAGYAPRGTARLDETTLKLLKNKRFGLIIVDESSPDHNDHEKIRELKARKTDSTPIIMTSTNPDLQDRAKRAGADGYVQKPFGMQELLQEVEQHLSCED